MKEVIYMLLGMETRNTCRVLVGKPFLKRAPGSPRKIENRL
jgi:hypothetical protein